MLFRSEYYPTYSGMVLRFQVNGHFFAILHFHSDHSFILSPFIQERKRLLLQQVLEVLLQQVLEVLLQRVLEVLQQVLESVPAGLGPFHTAISAWPIFQQDGHAAAACAPRLQRVCQYPAAK